MSSTISLNSTITWAKSFVANLDPTVMTGNEPALTSANLVKSTILGPPFTWRWNRVTTGFICTAGQQDYMLLNWTATFAVKLGWLTVDDAGNSQSVTTAGTTGAVAPTWNHTKGATTTDGSVTWTNLGAIGVTVSQTYNLSWIETASIQDINTSSPKWMEIDDKNCLGVDSVQGRPHSVAAQGDDGSGNISFRMMPVPDVAYPVAITLQQKATLFTGLNGFWSPLPDEYSYIYNWGFLTLLYLYADDGRWAASNQKFVASLLGTQEGLTETQRNIFLNDWQAVTGQPMANTMRLQQGTQFRGI